MINLLPPDIKESYRYARRNVSLRKWVIALLIAFIGLGALGTFGLLTIQQSSLQFEKEVATSEEILKKEQYRATQKRVQDIGNSFKLVVRVLSQEVLFSQLLKQIGASIPTNANLTGLTISQTQGGLDITAVATDYKTASQVQVNLSDPDNKIFSKADIVSINCETTASSSTSESASLDAQYPCKVTVRALFAANNPFLFINSKGVKP